MNEVTALGTGDSGFGSIGSIGTRGAGELALSRTHPDHIRSRVVPESSVQGASRTDSGEVTSRAHETSSFGSLLANSLTQVSDLDKTHAALTRTAIVDPQSVDTHEITISASQAALSLSLARNVIDRVIGAYREITSLR